MHMYDRYGAFNFEGSACIAIYYLQEIMIINDWKTILYKVDSNSSETMEKDELTEVLNI